jgi:hypothetical protein
MPIDYFIRIFDITWRGPKQFLALIAETRQRGFHDAAYRIWSSHNKALQGIYTEEGFLARAITAQ